MAYTNGFSGDTRTLPYIVKVLEQKSYAVKGLVNPNLSISASGETIQYYVNDASSVGDGKLGQKLDFTATGVKAKTIAFDACKTIKAVLPYVNIATVTADVLGDKVTQESITAVNGINEDFAAVALANAEEIGVSYDASDVYGSILGLRAAFVTANKKNNLKPTGILASPAVYSALLKANLIFFKDGLAYGQFSDLTIVECADLATGVVMVNENALYSASNVNTLAVVDATPAGYPNGTIVAGEIGFLNGVCELPAGFDGKLIVKFSGN